MPWFPEVQIKKVLDIYNPNRSGIAIKDREVIHEHMKCLMLYNMLLHCFSQTDYCNSLLLWINLGNTFEHQFYKKQHNTVSLFDPPQYDMIKKI